jgi:hypothetical protein
VCDGWTPAHHAAWESHVDVLRLLVFSGRADLAAVGSAYSTPTGYQMSLVIWTINSELLSSIHLAF